MITSRKNPWFRRFRNAIEQHESDIALEGPKAIRDAIRLGWRPIVIAVNRPQGSIPPEVPLIELERRLFSNISDTVHSQGMIALFERPATRLQSLFSDLSGVIAIVDGIQDPGNVGTILRLSAAFEVSGVVLFEGSADPFGAKAIRASAGAVLSVPLCRTTRDELLGALERHQFELWVADPRAPANAKMPSARIAIAFGSEGQGVSAELLERARRISIPTSPRVESLNVAAAAAILLSKLYEARRSGTLSAGRERDAV